MKLIDEAAIVASIEQDIKEYSRAKKEHPDCEYYKGALDILEDFRDEFLDTLETKAVDLEEESMNYLLNEHKSPLSKVMHGVDLRTEMQYHKDIQDAFKAGFKKAMEE